MSGKQLLLKDLRVSDLKSELEKRGLVTSGIKAVLAERLQTHLVEEGFDPETFNFATPSDQDADPKPGDSVDEAAETTDDDTLATDPTVSEPQGTAPAEECQTSPDGDASAPETKDVEASKEEPECSQEEEKETQDSEPMELFDSGNHLEDADFSEASVQLENEAESQLENEAESQLEDEAEVQHEEEAVVQHDDEVKVQNNVEAEVQHEDEAEVQNEVEEEGLKGPTKVSDSLEKKDESKPKEEEDSINLMLGEDEEDMFKDEVNGGQSKSKKEEDEKEKEDEAKQAEVVQEGKPEEPKESVVDANVEKDKKEEEKIKLESRRNLWISGLSSATRATDLKELFSKYGKVVGAKVVTNAKTPGARCYGYITMGTSEEARAAIKELHKTEKWGRIITVEQARADMGGPSQATKSGGTERKSEEKKSGFKSSEAVKTSSGEVKVSEKQNPDTRKPSEGSDSSRNRRRDDPPTHSRSQNRDMSRSSSRDRRPKELHTRRQDRSPVDRRPAPPIRPRHRSPVSNRSSSPKRVGNPGVLTFNQIRDHRRVEREREEERRRRQRERQRQEDEEQRRREEDRARRHEEEKLKLEREELRREREKLEREKQELLRFERERQKMERERLQREKEELERLRRQQAIRLEEARRATKRPIDIVEPTSHYYDDRKRIAPDPRGPDRVVISGSLGSSRSGRGYESSSVSGSHSYDGGSRSTGAIFTTRSDERSERSLVYEKQTSSSNSGGYGGRSDRDHRGHISGSSSSSRGGAGSLYTSQDPWPSSSNGSASASAGIVGRSSANDLGASGDLWTRSSSSVSSRPLPMSGSGMSGSSSGRGGTGNGIAPLTSSGSRSSAGLMPNPFGQPAIPSSGYPSSASYRSGSGSGRYDDYKPHISNSKHY